MQENNVSFSWDNPFGLKSNHSSNVEHVLYIIKMLKKHY